MAKLRGKTPTLISGSSGKPAATIAKKKRQCKRCKEDIILGDKIFEIPKTGGGFTQKTPYCMSCFKDILEETKKDLSAIEEVWDKNNE